MKVPKTIDVCGIEHRVVFVSAKRMLKEAGTEAFGCVDKERCIIYLLSSLKAHPSLLRDVLIHEAVGHALLENSGLAYWLQVSVNLKGKKWFRWQETFVRFHTPMVIATLRSMGLLAQRKAHK